MNTIYSDTEILELLGNCANFCTNYSEISIKKAKPERIVIFCEFLKYACETESLEIKETILSAESLEKITKSIINLEYLTKLSFNTNYWDIKEKMKYFAHIIEGCKNIEEFGIFNKIEKTSSLSYAILNNENTGVISQSFAKNSSITRIILNQCDIGESGIIFLSNSLSINNICTELSLHSCSLIGMKGCKKLCEIFISKSTTLRKLDLGGCLIGTQGCESLVYALLKNDSVIDLDISKNYLYDASAQVIGYYINRSKSIRKLNLHNNELTHSGVWIICKEIFYSNTLQNIDLSANEIGINSCKTLCEILINENCSLKSLNLEFGSLNLVQFKQLANSFPDNKSLTELLLANNTIGNKEAPYIFEKLIAAPNNKITQLSLARCKISDKGAKCIAEFLKSGNCILQKLDLEFNSIKYKGAGCLGEALVSNKSLNYMSLTKNSLSISGCISIMNGMQKNKGIKSLFIRNIHATELCIKNICDMIIENNTLSEFDCSENFIDFDAIRKILTVLQQNHRIKRIYIQPLCNNTLAMYDKEIIESLLSLLCKANSLLYVSIFGKYLTDELEKKLCEFYNSIFPRTLTIK